MVYGRSFGPLSRTFRVLCGAEGSLAQRRILLKPAPKGRRELFSMAGGNPANCGELAAASSRPRTTRHLGIVRGLPSSFTSWSSCGSLARHHDGDKRSPRGATSPAPRCLRRPQSVLPIQGAARRTERQDRGPQPLRIYCHGQQAAAPGIADSIHCDSRSGSSSNGGRTATGPHRTKGRAGGEAI